MFDLDSTSTFIAVGAILGVIALVSGFKARNLPTPKKELHHLRTALFVFGAAGYFVIFSFSETVYFTLVPEHISSLDEAQKILRQQQEDLAKLTGSIQNFSRGVQLIALLGVVGVLPTLYAFVKAVMTKDETDHQGSRKPVLNLDED